MSEQTLDSIGCPSAVWILGKRWAVIPMKKITYNDDCGPTWGCAYGYCWFERLEIELRPDMPEACLREVLLHEILHAIDVEMIRQDGELTVNRLFKFKRDPDQYRNLSDVLHSEGDVRVYSNCIYSIMTDPRNAGLADWVFHGQGRLYE